MQVSELMTREPIIVDPDVPISEAIELLRARQIRHLPVVMEHKLVGILSERDLREYFAPPLFEDNVTEVRLDEPVRDVMTTDPIVVVPETEVAEAIELMLENRVGALPVVNSRSSYLVGILSYVDILRELRDRLDGN